MDRHIESLKRRQKSQDYDIDYYDDLDDLGEEDIPLLQETLKNGGYTKFLYGLPDVETNTVCKQIYKNDIVKLTLQISESEALQIKRDIRVTFADQLGVVGMKIMRLRTLVQV